MDSNSKTWCPVPWIHQQIRSNGEVRICCFSLETGSDFNVRKDSLDDAFNSDIIKRVRKNMLNGEWDPVCGKCKQEEEMGISTSRINETNEWKDRFTIHDAIEHTTEDGTTDLKSRYWDIRFGNFCNLKCRMCSPDQSHSWYEEWTAYNKEEGFQDSHKYVKLYRNENGRLVTDDYDWHMDEHFWTQLESGIENVEYIFMAGGEPLLIERQEQFLKLCIDKGFANRITLAYNTNLSNLPSKLVDLWKHFKQVRVGASIDGMGKVLEYQRYPIKWEPTLKNLKKLNQVSADYPNIVSAITATVTVYNIFQMPEFMWWKVHESGLDYINGSEILKDQFPVILMHMAHHPVVTNIQILPAHIKEQVRQHYAVWLEKFKDNKYAIGLLENVLNFMDAEDKSEHLEEFAKYNKFLDETRGQDLKEVVPQLVVNLI